MLDNKMIGKYVIVRCKDAGVHDGVLEAHIGRECVLTASPRQRAGLPRLLLGLPDTLVTKPRPRYSNA